MPKRPNELTERHRPSRELVIEDVPKTHSNKAKPIDRPGMRAWKKALEFVREQQGKTVRILQHPKGYAIVNRLRDVFEDFAFVTRNMEAHDGTKTVGIWAKLKMMPADLAAEVPPVDRVLSEPVF